jgi:polyhydroxybutyrate depolymerase
VGDFADTPGSLDVAGVKRTYVMNVPGQLGTAVPLVLAFHGHGGDGAGEARLTRLDDLSDRFGFIVVYPDGIDRAWNDGRPQNAGSDDIGFVSALVADLERRYPIDKKRIYATGFSNGGSFTQYLGCKLANQFAAIAPVSGYLPVVDVDGCKPSRPLPVLEIGGTSDPIMPYKGGDIYVGIFYRGAVLSAEDTAALWRANARCAAVPVSSALPPVVPADGTSITRSVYASCAAGTSVVLDTVVGGGHTWPDGPQYQPPSLIGLASNQLDASAAIVDFFFAHPMP